MSRIFAQWMVLAAIGVAFCQGISEDVPAETADSTIVNVVPAAGDSSTDGNSNVSSTSGVSVPRNDSALLVSDSVSIEEAPDMPTESGELQKTDDSLESGTKAENRLTPERKIKGGRSGIGVNLTFKLIWSTAINDYLEDLYEKMKDDANGSITDENGFSAMPVMMGLKVKGVIFIGPVLGLEPFGTINYGIKLMRIRNLDEDVTTNDKDVTTNFMEYGGGLNLWARVSPARVVSFKAGLGGYVTYTYLNVESYDGAVEHSGIGGGINLLAGIDVTLKRITINVDFSVPIGSSELGQDGTFTNRGNNRIRYPDGYRHTGLEIRPGITFNF